MYVHARIVSGQLVIRELRNRPDFADVAMTDRFRTMFSPYEEMRIEGVTYARDKDVPSAFRAAVSDRTILVVGLYYAWKKDALNWY